MSTFSMPDLLSYADVDARLGGVLSAEFEGAADEPDDPTVLFFDGDLTLDGDFLSAVAELRGVDGDDDVELIVVTGDLTVNGPIALYEDQPGLYVGGHTRAETLEGGDAEIFIHDGTFTHMVYGYYNHGSLAAGVVDTPWVIDFDHHMALTAPGARWVDNLGVCDRDVDFVAGNGLGEAFVPEVVDNEGRLDIDTFLNQLRAGLPVLRPGARSARESAAATLDDQLSRALADRADHLDLTGRKLKAFPTEVLRMPWLRTLILDRNPIRELPEEIGTLTGLELLSVRDCKLTALPGSIGDLTGLRVLRVAGNSSLDENEVEFTLPAAVGRLSALEELDISSLSVRTGAEYEPGGIPPESTRFVLPDTFGGLVGMRKLIADGTNVVFPDSARGLTGVEEVSMSGTPARYLVTFPEVVTTFPNLRRLDLSGNNFDTVPDSLLQLTRLVDLDLGGSLGLLRAPLPDLGRLPALQVLGFSGQASRGPEPGHVFLRELFAMELTGLEELRIDRWRREGKRRRLKPEHFAGIGTFRRLRSVRLAFNGLEDLPPDFDTLPDLETVDLDGNRIPREVRDRITAAHPSARIDFGS
ncbi:leucine-rich repeat domain-containing protein [Nocardia sp. CWNU-33]|uniref:leucine-rich repeat domain-containing protein n=1 Tax=Nocardia sp. CWNU-33 TaxID=3392117 RepID=UPI00398E33BC